MRVMLTALSIRDIVLIEKLDVVLDKGLTVLTGETGAGKSILLDALGLALGARGDSSLVRTGAERGVVTAAFALPRNHPAFSILKEQGVDADGELVIRRIQNADGPSRAAINDQPVSLNLLRQIAGALAEIHGQHADREHGGEQGHRDARDHGHHVRRVKARMHLGEHIGHQAVTRHGEQDARLTEHHHQHH